MGYLNLETFSKHGCFGLDQISRTTWHGPNVSMDILTGPNVCKGGDDEPLSSGK